MSDLEAFANEVVGPIRTSILRKKAIHEELLSHLTESAERAREQGVVPGDLAAHVLKRFGDVATVREEIEMSLPLWQRVLYPRMRNRRVGEGDFRYAARMSGYGSILIAAIVAFPIVSFWLKKGYIPFEMILLLAAPVVAFIFLLGFFVLDIRIRRNVQQGNWRTAILQAFLNGAAIGLVPVATTMAHGAVDPAAPHVIAIGRAIGVGLFAILVPVFLYAPYWASHNCPWIEDLGRDV